MNLLDRLRALGFSRTIVLDGPSCGVDEKSLIFALWTYTVEKSPATDGAWIHPYYRASHHAYQAARGFVEECSGLGLPVTLRDDVRIKPIFARLPGFTQGMNTLSYTPDAGSRFYVKTFAVDLPLQPTTVLEDEKHGLHCGSCRRCMEACPTKAITEEGFHVERCLRFWMMPGKPVPEEIRAHMGNKLIGCDECQRCCPHNEKPKGEASPAVPLDRLLAHPKEVAQELKDVIGANLTLPNRVLAQACMLAGCSGDRRLLPAVQALQQHPSEAVRVHACWAAEKLLSD